MLNGCLVKGEGILKEGFAIKRVWQLVDRKKNQYFYIVMGYIGTLLILIAVLRYILIIDDVIGRGLMTFGLIFILSSLRFMETKFLTVKERRIVNWSFFSVAVIIFIIGFIFV
ncbi:hypothetical protein [Bacillus sp. JJ1764]|uniref:hypothetical protein n=1 Tax=Bacillus sp. JJ1764 TaxID=3122964 RepID=UPI002FFFFF8E